MKSYLQNTRDKVLNRANEASRNPSQALSSLRSTAKSYTFLIPGLSSYVDDVFDELEDLHDEHADEMDSIFKETAEKLKGLVQNRRPDAETIRNVSAIAGNAAYRMKELGGKAGNNFLNKHPIVREKLGSSYEQLQSVAQRTGLEGWKALHEARTQMKELVAKGKLDGNSVAKVRESFQEKTSALRSRVPGYEKIDGIFGWKDLDKYKERAEGTKNSAKGAISGVLSALGERGKKTKDNTERTNDESEK